MNAPLQSFRDAAAARASTAGITVRHPARVLSATILASSLAFVDGSVVNVGLPAIGASLHADPAALQWVINAYALVLAVLLITCGRLGDLFGQRTLFFAGVALFTVASAA